MSLESHAITNAITRMVLFLIVTHDEKVTKTESTKLNRHEPSINIAHNRGPYPRDEHVGTPANLGLVTSTYTVHDTEWQSLRTSAFCRNGYARQSDCLQNTTSSVVDCHCQQGWHAPELFVSNNSATRS